jgi:mRNA deadenylase 3'-5' endonuclease subunit Ccr4
MFYPTWALSWHYSQQNLLQEIIGYNADIPYLQKVKSDHFWRMVRGQSIYNKQVLQLAQIRTTIWIYLNNRYIRIHRRCLWKLQMVVGCKVQCVFRPSKFKVSPGMYHLHLIIEFEISMWLLKTTRRTVIILLSCLWTGVLKEYCQNLNCFWLHDQGSCDLSVYLLM